MSEHTFTPGTRVSDTGKNITGTVADDPAMVAEYPCMIPVHWDNGDKTVASPAILAPAAFNVAAFEAVTRTKHNIPAGFHVDARALMADVTTGELTRSGFKAGFWESGPVVFDDADGEPVMMRGRWNEHDGAHLVLSLVDEQYAIGIPAKTAQYVIEALQEVASPAILAPAVGLEAFTDAQLSAELQRREDEVREAECAAAGEYVQKHPDTLHRDTGIGELADLADTTGLSVLALSAIWFETYGKKASK